MPSKSQAYVCHTETCRQAASLPLIRLSVRNVISHIPVEKSFISVLVEVILFRVFFESDVRN